MLEHLIVFGGKGGVGKSSISAATALRIADMLPDKKILLISFDIAHNLSDLFKIQIGNKICQVTENLWAIEPDPDEYAEQYTKEFSAKARKLVKSFPIVGAIPDLEKFIDETFTSKTIPLALKNSIFFQSILDADHPIENLDVKDSRQTPFNIIVADFPPTGNMISLFEIPENHIQQLLKYTLQMVEQIQKFMKTVRKVTKAMNPLTWLKKENEEEKQKREIARELLDDLYNLELRGKRISQLMKTIGSLRLVTIAEKPSAEEAKRARDLSLPYIHVEGIHINRLLNPASIEHCKFCKSIYDSQQKYLNMIQKEFKDMKIWTSEYLENEPIGLDGLRALAASVYKNDDIQQLLNPMGREIKRPDFLDEEYNTSKNTKDESKDDSDDENSEFTDEEIQEYLKKVNRENTPEKTKNN